LQAPAGFGKARPRRQPSSPIWPPPLRTSRRPSSISPAFPERACNVNQHHRSFDYGWADGTRVDVDFRRCAALVALLAARCPKPDSGACTFF